MTLASALIVMSWLGSLHRAPVRSVRLGAIQNFIAPRRVFSKEASSTPEDRKEETSRTARASDATSREGAQNGPGSSFADSVDDSSHYSNPFRSKYSLARPLEGMILRSRLTRDLDLARFLAKAASIGIYTVGAVTVLGTLGVDTKPIITGIGVTGFTLGFALKEIATNFLSGVLLVFNKPFKKGQNLKVMGAAAGQNMEGIVESIDARYVLLRARDGGLLMVPSVVVYTNPILVSGVELKKTS